jgi:hypothetical protein
LRIPLLIEERDLFYFIWDPEKLDPHKYFYLNSNFLKYKWMLQVLRYVYDSDKVKTDNDIIEKILKMINETNQ